jgi:antitoxin ParD1/3/4
MGQVSKMSIAVTPEMAALVAQAVDSGEYASNSEVFREALREWKQRRSLSHQDREQLRALWVEGLASGPATPDARPAQGRRLITGGGVQSHSSRRGRFNRYLDLYRRG